MIRTKAFFFTLSLFFLSLFFFIGCSTKQEPEVMQKKSLPAWYTNPPRSSETKLYAVGEGESREQALKNALNMMASTLSVSIESEFGSKKFVQEGVVNSSQLTTLNEIQSKVKRIRISHYEVLEAQEMGFRNHIVLIVSEKKKLFESLKSELEQKFAFAEGELRSLALHHALEQLNVYKKIQNELEDVPNTLVVMNVLQSSFNGDSYIHKMQKIQNAHAALLSSISFEIDSDEDSKNLQAPIRDALNAKKLQVASSGDKTHFMIFIKSDIQKASSYGFALARSAIEITVKDYKNRVIGSKKLNITGQSTQGFEIAKQSVAFKFGEMIKKEGIGKVLGVDL